MLASSLSSHDICNRNSSLIKQARKCMDIGATLGVKYYGGERENIKKHIELEVGEMSDKELDGIVDGFDDLEEDSTVRKRYGQEHQGRHNSVDNIRNPELVLGIFRLIDTGVERNQPPGRDEPAVDPPAHAEAVREVEEEAGKRAQGEQGGEHEGGDAVTRGATAVEGGDEGLEGEEGAGGEEVDQEQLNFFAKGDFGWTTLDRGNLKDLCSGVQIEAVPVFPLASVVVQSRSTMGIVVWQFKLKIHQNRTETSSETKKAANKQQRPGGAIGEDIIHPNPVAVPMLLPASACLSISGIILKTCMELRPPVVVVLLHRPHLAVVARCLP
ncbi:hypothetical protein RHSIM_Rhsim10G0037400 [Rhododendron simsii]|uniref:Uncharacterized protein n=1 Tax=Rhododendron simsii TaxID=118357 RepID=A0A834GDU1_RHOSS|nr:hypothetical protein RHSIM_Rhsim10G0037400 [Rhododendron simsii]